MLTLAQMNGFEPYEGAAYFWFCLLAIIIFVISYINVKPIDQYIAIDDDDDYIDEEPIGSDPMTEEDWNVICRTAIEKAKAGDSNARNWVTKNVIENPSNSEKPTPNSSGTSQQVIKDAVDILRKSGHTKADAVKIVRERVKAKTYTDVVALVADAFAK